MEKEQEDGPFYAGGKIVAGAELTVSISFKNKKIKTAKLGLITSVGLNGEAGVKISAEKEAELLKKPLGSLLLPSVPLAGGLIQINPSITPYLLGKAEGEIVNNIEFSTKIKNEFHADYIDGKWTSQSAELPSPADKPFASPEAPWHLGGSLSFKGGVSVSLYNEFNIKLYNRDDMKVYISPEIGTKLSGELAINDSNAASLAQILKDAKLSSSLYLGGEIGLDASLLVPGDMEAKIEIDPFEFCKREIPLFRVMSQLFAKLNDDKAEEPLKADVHMEAAGPQLLKEAEMAIVLENEAEEIVATGEPIDYDAVVGDEIKEDPIPIRTTFENLKSDVQYTSYPVIQSPILKEIVPEGKLELRFNEVSFKASGSIREQLIRLYKDTDGDNWTHNENWCSDKPIIRGMEYVAVKESIALAWLIIT